MPNWCSTNIRISGKKNDINRLYKRFSEAIELDDGDRKPGYFTSDLTHYGQHWLGNLLLYIGEDVENTNIRCRGTVSYYELCDDGEGITIQTDTAWVPMIQVFVKFKNKYAPNAEISFCAEEPGCELYWRSDDSWEKYFVEFYEEEAEEEAKKIITKLLAGNTIEYMCEKSMREFLTCLLSHDGEIDSLIAEALEKYEEQGLRIREFELMDLCEVS